MKYNPSVICYLVSYTWYGFENTIEIRLLNVAMKLPKQTPRGPIFMVNDITSRTGLSFADKLINMRSFGL